MIIISQPFLFRTVFARRVNDLTWILPCLLCAGIKEFAVKAAKIYKENTREGNIMKNSSGPSICLIVVCVDFFMQCAKYWQHTAACRKRSRT